MKSKRISKNQYIQADIFFELALNGYPLSEKNAATQISDFLRSHQDG